MSDCRATSDPKSTVLSELVQQPSDTVKQTADDTTPPWHASFYISLDRHGLKTQAICSGDMSRNGGVEVLRRDIISLLNSK